MRVLWGYCDKGYWASSSCRVPSYSSLNGTLTCINNPRNSAIQPEEIIFISRMWQRGSLSVYNDSKSWRIDSKSWCHERQVRFLLKRQTSARTALRTRAFIILRDDRHVWTDRNSLTGRDRHWVKCKFSKVFLHKLHLKCIQNVEIAVIMTIITAHHLFFGHCVNLSVIVLDLGIFLRELRSLRKIPRSKTITSDFTQWPQKDGAQLLLSK